PNTLPEIDQIVKDRAPAEPSGAAPDLETAPRLDGPIQPRDASTRPADRLAIPADRPRPEDGRAAQYPDLRGDDGRAPVHRRRLRRCRVGRQRAGRRVGNP